MELRKHLLTIFDSYEDYSPISRQDFLQCFLKLFCPLLGHSIEDVRLRHAPVMQQEPTLNECGIHVVNNLCSFLFYPATFSRVNNVLTRKNLSKSWWPCGPGIPSLPEKQSTDEETVGALRDSDSDCEYTINLIKDVQFEDATADGWELSEN